jgi:basic membrane lipoprotein Med (substrate-binding protein (PBP1-ABC) superfamily)
LVALLSLVLTACGQAAAPAEAPAEEAAKVSTLKIAVVTTTTLEEPWNTAMVQSLDRMIAVKPHDLQIEYVIQENVASPDGERVMREYAKTGEYGIIWAHGLYPDAVTALYEEYPDIVWAMSGSGYEPIGKNAYWVQMYVHEPAYLLGMIAGMMTESNVIGAVAAYPYPNVNLPINAYVAGAKSVNPDVKVKMTYIESWFDPAKAKESTLAQIATGADFVYAERFGPFEACQEKGVYAFGHYVDQNSLAPETVVASTLARWDPVATFLVDEWWNHVVDGKEYAAPMKEVVYFMKDGGSDITGYNALDAKIPQEVKDAVADARQKIMNGELEVPYNEEPVVSD